MPPASLKLGKGQRTKKENRRENSKSCLCVESQRCAGPRIALWEAADGRTLTPQEKPSLQQMKLISWGNSWQKRETFSPRTPLARENERWAKEKKTPWAGRKSKAWGLDLLHCGQGHVSSPSRSWVPHKALWVVGAEDRSAPAWRDVQDVSHLKAEVKGGTIITRRGMFTSPVSVFCRNQREPAC